MEQTLGGIADRPVGLIETNLTMYVSTIIPAKYFVPMTVDPEPGN
jgi:hypothetical protein